MQQLIQKSVGKHILKSHALAGFTLLEFLYPPKLKQLRHTHEFASFSFVLEGSYLENYKRHALTRHHSTIIFHPPQESHAVNFHNQVRILSVQIDFQRLAYIRDRSVVLDSSASCRSETVAWLGRRIYQEFHRMDGTSALAIEGCIFEILAEASRSKVHAAERKSTRWLERVKEFLHGNFSEPFIYEDVAKVAGVHPVHLARVFREQNGCTIGEYVRRLRVDFALRQLSETENPLSEIAAAAGFADHSHFTRTFKAYIGLTPSEYRKNPR